MGADSLAVSGLGDDASDELLGWSRLEELASSVDIAEIEQAYEALELEEARVDVEVAECVEGGADAERRLAQLSLLQEDLITVTDRIGPLQAVIDATAANAGVISERVRFLDQERAKLEHALRMVRETSKLKRRVGELLAAMASKETDAAAALVHECRTSDAETLHSPFVAFATPDASQRAGPGRGALSEVIADATRELVERVSFMFQAAMEENNTREISRCFKLFPLLGEELRGLDMYSDFLCDAIGEKARLKSEMRGNIYALRITRLFEVIATVVDNHFPLVNLHYGPGRMIRVIQRLQLEGAKRACMVLDFFEEERHVKRRLAQIQQADASAMRAKAQARSAALVAERAMSARSSEDSISDAEFKDITNVLAEMVLIGRQVATFHRFLASRAAPEAKALAGVPGGRDRVYLRPETAAKFVPLSAQASRDAGVVFDDETGLVGHTALTARLAWLTDVYVALEVFFITRSVAKAMALDDADSLAGWQDAVSSDSGGGGGGGAAKRKAAARGLGARVGPGAVTQGAAFGPDALGFQQTSSCVGDMFFVVKTALEHAISIQRPAAVGAVAQCVISTMNSEFLAAMEVRALSSWSSAAGQAHSQRRILVALNNLDLACAYLQKTAEELRAMIGTEWPRTARQDDLAAAQTAIDTFAAFSAKFAYAKQRSLDQLGAQLLKPWMRTTLQHSYRDIKYVLTDEEFNDMQNDNLFQKRFVIKFGHLVQQLRPRLTAANLAAALELAIGSLAQDWERAIRQSKFNMLGGIMFEKDVREIQRYLEQESGVSLRPKFSRLVQMADALAVESAADIKHILKAPAAADAPSHAPLSTKEIRGLLENRVDIADSTISSLGI
ncbi:Golgi transport complex subunit 4 [Coemansia biformis]|uniref:Conserved oligomeric Golgi complex subunit 4 n=1 Tax=Coemansia biformis TaxID=1286918 RepID=A0A9W8CZD2_9FUNG|nr:Golgi transport complex subunit 4 [Coemansia biformis]